MLYLRKQIFPVIAFASLLFACNSSEIGDSKDVNPESIYIVTRFCIMKTSIASIAFCNTALEANQVPRWF